MAKLRANVRIRTGNYHTMPVFNDVDIHFWEMIKGNLEGRIAETYSLFSEGEDAITAMDKLTGKDLLNRVRATEYETIYNAATQDPNAPWHHPDCPWRLDPPYSNCRSDGLQDNAVLREVLSSEPQHDAAPESGGGAGCDE